MSPARSTAVVLTPVAPAAIAVIRASGPRVSDFLGDHFSHAVPPGRPVHGELRDGDRVIDDPVVVRVAEHAVEFCLHGGPWVVRAALELLRRTGFEIAERADSPMPFESVDAPSVDPLLARVEADALAALPAATTELGLRVLLGQAEAWKRWLTGHPTGDDVRHMLADRLVDRLLVPARVALAGPANAGKSTLANRLFGRQRSITADLPGTTRDWVGETAELAGVPVMLIDTPGLRHTDDPIEQAAIRSARPQIAQAAVVVVVLDGARPLDDEQLAALAAFPEALVVINKADQPAKWRPADLPTADCECLSIAASTGDGIAELTQAVLRWLGCHDLTIDRPRCWTPAQRAMIAQRFAGG